MSGNASASRHSREGGNPASFDESHWIPAFAGTTSVAVPTFSWSEQ